MRPGWSWDKSRTTPYGSQTRASARLEWQIIQEQMIKAFVQGERRLVPALKQNAQENITGQMHLAYTPHEKISG